MLIAPTGSKLVFTILIHRRSPGRFQQDWERQFRRHYPHRREEAVERRNRERFASAYPPIHRYNDIAGFAEIYWDAGTSLQINLYFRGDRRTRYGRSIAQNRDGTVSARNYYLYDHRIQGGFVPPRRSDILDRQAFLDAFREVRRIANRLRCFVDLRHEEAILGCFDFRALFHREPSDKR